MQTSTAPGLCPRCTQFPCTCAQEAGASQKPAPDTQEKEAPARDPLMDDFRARDDAPKAAEIDRWKETYGEVFLIGLSREEQYIFRPLLRLELKAIRSSSGNDDDAFKEAVVRKCVLWPPLSPEFAAACKAGTIDTLFEMIMHSSNFIDPMMALGLTRQL